jgi:hypothetical protein
VSLPLRGRAALAALPLCFAVAAAALAEDAPAPIARTEMRVLSADEVERYVAALRELTELGLEPQAAGDAPQAQREAAGMQHSQDMQQALARHAFDAASFGDVHWNVMMAYLAEAMSAQSEELEQARAQQQEMLAEMKQQMPPEQYEATAQAMEALLPALDAATAAPEQNRKLVGAHRAELDALFEDANAASE